MTAAEKLRKGMEQTAPFRKDEFINAISERIKRSGRAWFICDRHIRETDIRGGGYTIRMNHEQVATDYARSEGFRVSYERNGYGVRYIVFTL